MADDAKAADAASQDVEASPEGEAIDAKAPETEVKNVAETEAKADPGDTKSGEPDNESEGGKTEEGEPQTLEITLPEGMEAHKGQAEAYQTHMGGWLKDNPKATAADALKEAARWQAETVQKAQTDAQAAWDQQIEGWANEAKADEEIGGDAFDENVAVAKKALETYGSPELKDILDQSGLGSHKAVIAAFYKVGKELAQAGVEPSSGMVANYDPLAARYPSSRSAK